MRRRRLRHPVAAAALQVRRAPRALRRLAALMAAALGACTAASSDGDTRAPSEPSPGAAGESVAIVRRCAWPAADAAAVQVRRDLAYAAPGGDTLRLDLALPAGSGPHPVVLLLHGGGWEGGDRRAMHQEMRLLAGRGYAAAAAEYRLTYASRNVFPAAVQDVRCAVRWLRRQAPSLGLDPARVGVYGYSAGAHLASMLGVSAPVPEPPVVPVAPGGGCAPAADEPFAVQAVVSAAGPQDLRVNGPYTQEQARLVTNFLGVFPGDAPEVAAQASPILHVSARSAPFLLVHGTRDDLVPVSHARRMRDALRQAGVPATLLELPGAGHGLPTIASTDPSGVSCTTVAFLDRWLKGGNG